MTMRVSWDKAALRRAVPLVTALIAAATAAAGG